MKVVTILGTRPEIIRLCRVIEKLDRLCEHRLVHTGQNFEDCLSGIFFQEFAVRRPDYFLDVREKSFGQQVGSPPGTQTGSRFGCSDHRLGLCGRDRVPRMLGH